MALLTVAEARSRTLLYAGIDGAADAHVDRCIQNAGKQFVNATQCNRTSGTGTFTINDSEVDLSGVTDFRHNEFMSLHIALNDRSTWATSTAYVKWDLVKGDGSPDSFLYRCDVAHTSSGTDEPGSGTANALSYWTRVHTKLPRQKITGPVDYDTLVNQFIEKPETGEPEILAFSTDGKLHVWPSPDEAYPSEYYWNTPFATWTPGATPSPNEMNIPEQWIDGVLMWGAGTILNSPHPDALASDPAWRLYINSFIPEAKGQISPPIKWTSRMTGRKRSIPGKTEGFTMNRASW
jgi:hypothetical protein